MKDINEHPYYKYMELSKKELLEVLESWSRQDLINWLSWNDPNGIYNDEDSLNEIGNILTYDEGVEIMVKQIIENQPI